MSLYRCRVYLVKEDDGYSAMAADLAGAGSCGGTEEDAIERASEALRIVITAYRRDHRPVPWKATKQPEGSTLKYVMVKL